MLLRNVHRLGAVKDLVSVPEKRVRHTVLDRGSPRASHAIELLWVRLANSKHIVTCMGHEDAVSPIKESSKEYEDEVDSAQLYLTFTALSCIR